MIETEIKKLTEALTENNRLLQEHIDIRKDNNPDGTAKCCKKEEPTKTEVKKEEPEPEKDATQDLIDKANAREEKKREAAKAKKAAAAKAKAKAEKEAEEEEEETPEPVKADTGVTADDLREYVQGIRKQLKADDGPKAVSKHRKDFRELLKDGGYNSISDIPTDEMTDFLEDTKALVE